MKLLRNYKISLKIRILKSDFISEVEEYYCSKKNKYRKRYENAKLSVTD